MPYPSPCLNQLDVQIEYASKADEKISGYLGASLEVINLQAPDKQSLVGSYNAKIVVYFGEEAIIEEPFMVHVVLESSTSIIDQFGTRTSTPSFEGFKE